MKSKGTTVWNVFVKLVNSKPICSEFSRSELISVMMLGMFGKTNYSDATVDYLRNLAEKVGFIGKTGMVGRYIVVEHIPEDCTTSVLRKLYDEHQKNMPSILTDPKEVRSILEGIASKMKLPVEDIRVFRVFQGRGWNISYDVAKELITPMYGDKFKKPWM